MTSVDQFESVFRHAAKERYRYHPQHIRKAVLLGDEGREATSALLARVQKFLGQLRDGQEREWVMLSGADYSSLNEAVGKLAAVGPDLLVTSRCLKEEEKNPPYSLGVYLDVLAQTTAYPILVLPDFDEPRPADPLERLGEVMVVTDHITGDDRLIDWGVYFTPDGGKLVLSHVEDEHRFERWIEVISKISEIDTDVARDRIRAQLLLEPTDFIQSCTDVLRAAGVPIEILSEVRLGHRIRDYQKLVEAHQIDLLVLNGRHEGQRAMPGRSYAITVEFHKLPLLLL